MQTPEPEEKRVNPLNPEGKSLSSTPPFPASNQWLEFLSLGWIFAGTLTLSVGGGAWLDHHYKTTPLFLLIGVLFGFLGCGYSMFGMVKKLTVNDSEKTLK